uniref:Uncharacterized protein n=1 Tax=Myotis myotis TaxID=51298 RepID=A0A7J7XHK3_MYOMY|nr:hypothetical protein mMyoMyo1_011578 [Myotis myotis]
MPLGTSDTLNILVSSLVSTLLPLITMISLSSGKQGPGTFYFYFTEYRFLSEAFSSSCLAWSPWALGEGQAPRGRLRAPPAQVCVLDEASAMRICEWDTHVSGAWGGSEGAGPGKPRFLKCTLFSSPHRRHTPLRHGETRLPPESESTFRAGRSQSTGPGSVKGPQIPQGCRVSSVPPSLGVSLAGVAQWLSVSL